MDDIDWSKVTPAGEQGAEKDSAPSSPVEGDAVDWSRVTPVEEVGAEALDWSKVTPVEEAKPGIWEGVKRGAKGVVASYYESGAMEDAKAAEAILRGDIGGMPSEAFDRVVSTDPNKRGENANVVANEYARRAKEKFAKAEEWRPPESQGIVARAQEADGVVDTVTAVAGGIAEKAAESLAPTAKYLAAGAAMTAGGLPRAVVAVPAYMMGADARDSVESGVLREQMAREGTAAAAADALAGALTNARVSGGMERKGDVAQLAGTTVGLVLPVAGSAGQAAERGVVKAIAGEAAPGILAGTAAKAAGVVASGTTQGVIGAGADVAEQVLTGDKIDWDRVAERAVSDATLGAGFDLMHAGAEVKAARERAGIREQREAGVMSEFAARNEGRLLVPVEEGNAEGGMQKAEVDTAGRAALRAPGADLPAGVEVMRAGDGPNAEGKRQDAGVEGAAREADAPVPPEVLAKFAEEEDAALRMGTDEEAARHLVETEAARLAPLEKPFLSADEWYGTLGRRQVEREVNPETGEYAGGAVRWDRLGEPQLNRALDIPELAARAESELVRRARESEMAGAREDSGDTLRDLLAQGVVKLPGGADGARGGGDLGGELNAVKNNLGNQGAWMRYTDKGWNLERTLTTLHEHGFRQISNHADLLDALDAMARGKDAYPAERPAVYADAPEPKVRLTQKEANKAAATGAKAEHFAELPEADHEARRAFLAGEPVVKVSANQFTPGPEVKAKIKRWFSDLGNSVMTRSGKKVLLEGGVDSVLSTHHAQADAVIERLKVIGAVPEVIRKGHMISDSPDYKGKGMGRLVLAAPVELDGARKIVTVILAKDRNSTRYYLHDAYPENGNPRAAEGVSGDLRANDGATGARSGEAAGTSGARPEGSLTQEFIRRAQDVKRDAPLADRPVAGTGDRPEQGGSAEVPRPVEGERFSGKTADIRDETGGVRMAVPENALGMDLPGLVAMTRKLNGDIAPLVKKMTNNGEFSPLTRVIRLNRELFRNPKEAVRVLGHELGHLVDFLDDGTMKRGNLGGRLKSARDHLKQTFALDGVKYDEGKLATVLGEMRESARMRTEAVIGERPKAEPGVPATPEQKAAQKNWDKANRLSYAEIADTELPKRGFARDAAVRQELKAWSRAIKPFDEGAASPAYKAYRDSGAELYADAVSGIFVYPEAFAEAAPLTWRSWWRNLDAKPSVHEAVFDAQRLLAGTPEERAAAHSKDAAAGFDRGAEIYLQKAEEAKQGRSVAELWSLIKREGVDQFVDRKAGARTEANSQILNDADHADGKTWAWLGRLKEGTLDVIERGGVSAHDFAEYLMLRRVAHGDRSEGVANPHGYDGEYAAKLITRMRNKWTPEQAAAVGAAEAGIRARWREAMRSAVESGLYSPAQVQEMRAKSGDAYVPFAAVDHFEGNVGAGFAKVTGNLGDVVDPVLASALKATNIFRAAEMNKGKIAALDAYIAKAGEVGMERAETVRGADGRPGFKAPAHDMALVEAWRDGVKEGWYVPKEEMAPFENMTPATAVVMGRLLAMNFPWWRDAWITYNPKFVFVSGPMKDAGRAFTNMPDWAGSVRVPAEIAANVASRVLGTPMTESARVVRDMLEGRPNPLADRLVELGGMPPPHELFTTAKALDAGSNTAEALREMLRSRKLLADPQNHNGAVKTALKAVGRYMEKTGQTNEMTAKVAAYIHLTKKLGWEEVDAARFVRDYIGIPDTKQGGKHIRVAQAFMPFANVAVQGMRADARLLTGGEKRYAGLNANASRAKLAVKWGAKFMAGVGAYQALSGAALSGMLGEDAQEVFGNIPEHDLRTGLCIPIGTHTTAEGQEKTAYIKIPLDPVHAFLGSLMREGVRTGSGERGLAEGARGAGEAAANLLSGADPMIKLAGAWSDYVKGNNPIDDWRQSHILTEAQQAGRTSSGLPALAQMLKFTASQTGFYSYRKDDGGVKTGLDRAADLPLVGGILKVSNAGWREKLRGDDAAAGADAAVLRANLPEPIQVLKNEAASLTATRDTLQARVQAAQAEGREPDANDTAALKRANALKHWASNYRPLEKAAAEAKRRGDMTRVKTLVQTMERVSKRYYPGAERE